MAGACINNIKIVGMASLGLLTGSLAYQSFQVTPNVLHEISYRVPTLTSEIVARVKRMITISLVSNVALSGLATYLFTTAFKYSPANEKHPYIMYAALGAVLTAGSVAGRGFKSFLAILSRPNFTAPSKKIGKVNDSPSTEDEDSHLGKSYIHVSDDDSASTTPSASTPGSPVATATKSSDEDQGLDVEVENALAKKKIVNDLEEVNVAYFYGSIVSGISLLVSVIGLWGDFYL